MTQAASPFAYAAVAFLEACERRLVAVYFLKAKGRLGHQGIEWEAAQGQGPNLDDFPKVVGSHSAISIIRELEREPSDFPTFCFK